MALPSDPCEDSSLVSQQKGHWRVGVPLVLPGAA